MAVELQKVKRLAALPFAPLRERGSLDYAPQV